MQKKLTILALLSFSAKLMSNTEEIMTVTDTPKVEVSEVVCCDSKPEVTCDSSKCDSLKTECTATECTTTACVSSDDSMESKWTRIQNLVKQSEESNDKLKEKMILVSLTKLNQIEKDLGETKAMLHPDCKDAQKAVTSAKKEYNRVATLMNRTTQMLEKCMKNMEQVEKSIDKMSVLETTAIKKSEPVLSNLNQ